MFHKGKKGRGSQSETEGKEGFLRITLNNEIRMHANRQVVKSQDGKNGKR